MSEALREIEQTIARVCSPRPYPAPGPAFSESALQEFSLEVIAAHAADERMIDPPHRPAWDLLLLEAKRLVAALRHSLDIRFVDHEAYCGPQDIRDDVLGNRRLSISTLYCVHPLWSPEENCEFRVVHDILGHVLHPHPFSMVGEYLAFHEHMRWTDPGARQALFTEVCMYASIRYTVGAYPEVQRAIALPKQLEIYERRFVGSSSADLAGG